MRRILSTFLISILILQNLVIGTIALGKFKITILDNHQIESNPLGQSNNSPFEYNHASESNQIEIKLAADRQCNITRNHTAAVINEINVLYFIKSDKQKKQPQKTTIYQPNKHILYRNLLI